jgi:hypothetical protein
MSVFSRRKSLDPPQIKAVVFNNLKKVLFYILQEQSKEK